MLGFTFCNVYVYIVNITSYHLKFLQQVRWFNRTITNVTNVISVRNLIKWNKDLFDIFVLSVPYQVVGGSSSASTAITWANVPITSAVTLLRCIRIHPNRNFTRTTVKRCLQIILTAVSFTIIITQTISF